MAKTCIQNIFPTTLVSKQWDNTEILNNCLKAELNKMQAYDPKGVYRSNTGGTWHSRDTVLKECGPAGQELSKMFSLLFATLALHSGGHKDDRYGFDMAAWAMKYGDRGYATAHTHPNCHFSGVYYVDAGLDEEADITMATGTVIKPGTLEFIDTRAINVQVKGLNLAPGARIPPKSGLMIVFPSWLPHFVHPVKGDHERISIACNATIKDIKRKEE